MRFYRSLPFTVLTTLALMPTIQCGFAASGDVSNTSHSRAQDPGWPREITRNGVRLVYYQPQVDEWKNLRELRARWAFELTPNNGKPVVGVEEVRGETHTDLENRTVLIDNIEILNIRFPSLSGPDETQLQNLLKSTFPGKLITVSLDRVGVQAGQVNTKTVAVKTNPPPIFVSTDPAILLTVQGVPVLAPIKGLQLRFDGNVYKKDVNGDWSKWDNGGWQPVNTQGNLSSQNKEDRRQNSKGGTQDQGTPGATNQPSANGQTNADNRKGQASDKKSTQTNRQQSSLSAGTKRTRAPGTKGEGSNDLTSGLDREASARQRGSQNVNLQQKYQQRGTQRTRGSTGERQSRGSRGGSRHRD